MFKSCVTFGILFLILNVYSQEIPLDLNKVVIQFPYDSLPTVSDIDGNTYSTVKIGNQVWMTRNLLTTRYRNRDLILSVTNNQAWTKLTIGAQCTYNNTISKDTIDMLGRLYNFYAIADSRNIAPVGWHIATDAEWAQLNSTIGKYVSVHLKYNGKIPWRLSNVPPMNDAKFFAFPSGYRSHINGKFSDLYTYGYWWCGTEFDAELAWGRGMYSGNSYVDRYADPKTTANSVRCVKD